MMIASLQVELYMPGCGSLKEKRMVLNSLKSRIRNQLNVSVAEIDFLDKWQRSVLGFVSVSNTQKQAESVVDKVVSMVERDPRVQIIDQLKEVF